MTQPADGEFKAFTAVCTHQGCIVATSTDGTINCDCHGSKFSIEDGSVENGPATSPLEEVEITVKGERDHPRLRRRSPGRVPRRVGRVADPSTYRPAPGSIPTSPGVYRFRDAHGRVVYVGKAKNLRARLTSYFQDLGGPAPAHPDDGDHRGRRGVDRRRHRGRGAPAGVLLDQGVRPAVQREVPRRQVLPLARGHPQRGVPPRHGRARRQAQGRALLRSLLPRLGDPRDRRPAAAGLPDALVLQRRVQAVRADRPAVPARLHRQVLGALRRPGLRRGAPRDRRRLLRLHGRPDRRPSSSASRRRCTPPRPTRTTNAPPGCATTSAP